MSQTILKLNGRQVGFELAANLTVRCVSDITFRQLAPVLDMAKSMMVESAGSVLFLKFVGRRRLVVLGAVFACLALVISASGTWPGATAEADGLETFGSVPFTHIIIDPAPPAYAHVKAAGDIDGDGLPDAVIGGALDAFQEGLFWYRYPTWDKFTIVPPGVAGFTTDMQLRDVDGDGDIDVLVPHGNFNGETVHWHENPGPLGDPAVDPWIDHHIGNARAHDINAGDLDGDGDLDVQVRAQAEGQVTLFFQEPAGAWTKYQITGRDGEGSALGDIDGDGDLDVAINGHWLENPLPLGDPKVDPWPEYEIDLNWPLLLRVNVADVNMDGSLDILHAPSETGAGRLSWYEAVDPKLGPWTEHIIDPDVEFVHGIEPADINLDGFLDIATGEMEQSNDPDEISVYYGDGTGLNWNQQVVATTGTHNLKLADFGSDGDIDLLGVNWEGNQPFNLWQNELNPPIAFVPFKRHVLDSAKPEQSQFVINADLNGDGFDDVISGAWWYRNPIAPGNAWTRHEIPSPLNNVALAHDFDGDGDVDLFGTEGIGTNPNANFVWAQNNGAGVFTIFSNIQPGVGDLLSGAAIGSLATSGGTGIALSWRDSTAGIQLLTVGNDPAIDTWTWQSIKPTGTGGEVTAGDIDRDGNVDLMLGSEWLRNDSGTWTAFTTGAVPLVGGPDRNRLVDLNNDGRLDAVVGASSAGVAGELVWYEQPVVATDPWIRHDISALVVGGGMNLDIADMDLDGDTDVILSEHSLDPLDEPTLRTLIFENLDGSGGLWQQHIAAIGDEQLAGARAVDIDGDGDTDLISKGATHNRVLLLENKGINFPLSLDSWDRLTVDPNKPWRAIFIDDADIDGDGLPDIVTGGWWYRNPGSPSGVWLRNTIGSPVNNLAAIYDFDDDGDLDILGTQGIGSTSNSDFAWAQNDGTGVFTVFTNVDSGIGSFLQGTTVNRFSNGGPIEIALSWQGAAGGVQMLTVPADPTISNWTWRTLHGNAGGEGLDSGDIDGDGDNDILVASSQDPIGLEWLRNDGGGTFTLLTMHTPLTGQPDRVHLVDMDDDRDLDAVVGYGHDTAGKVAWYEQGAVVTDPWTEHLVANITNPQSVDVGDLDRDGDLDIVVGEHDLLSPASSQLFVFENENGGNTWTPHLIHLGDEHHDAAVLSDLEIDGDLDVISIGWTHSRVHIYANLGSASGAPPQAPPFATGEDYLAEQDVLLSVPAPGVLANDTDINGDTLSPALLTDVTNGVLNLMPDGSLTYLPNPGFTGVDGFTYAANDGVGNSNAVDVTITVKPPSVVGGNRVTTGLVTLYEFQEQSGDTVFDVSGNGTPLNLKIDNTAGVSWVPGGISIDSPTMIASPEPATKVISAAQANDEITVEAWVKPADLVQNGPARIVTLSADSGNRNFTLGQGKFGQANTDRVEVRLRSTTQSDNGTPAKNSPVGSLDLELNHVVFTRDSAGTLKIYMDGVETSSVVGGTLGNWDGDYRLGIANEFVNPRPWLGELHLVAIYDRALTATEVSQNLSAGANGVSGSGLTVTTQPTDQTVNEGETTSFTVLATGNGAVSYQWQQNLVDIPGATSSTYVTDPALISEDGDTFRARVTDLDGTAFTEQATLTVLSTNNPPVADDDAYSVDEDSVLSEPLPGVLTGDTDIDLDPLTAVLVATTTNGALVLNSDGSFNYTPDPDFNGIDTFTYQADDSRDLSNVATVTITVNPTNDAPTADNQVVSFEQLTPSPVTLTGADIDGDTLTFAVATSPTHGDLTGTAPNLIYTSDPGYTGPDSFTYVANDGTVDSPLATVSITVTRVNAAPVADDDSYSVDEDSTLVAGAPGVLVGDTDADGDPLIVALASDVSNGVLGLNADGSFTYTPNPDFSGADTFTYQADDTFELSNIATVTITVNPINDDPVADSQSVSTEQDVALPITLTGSDADGDPLTFNVTTQPINGTLSGVSPNLTYTPNPGYTGPDSLLFTVFDGLITSPAALVEIDVTVPNTGIVGYWSFDDGTANDQSGEGNHGIINGAVPDAGHDASGGLLFDGSNDYVDLGTLDVTDNGAQVSAVSVAAWVRSDQLTNCRSWDCRIFSKATGTGTQDHYLMIGTVRSGGEARLRFRLKTDGNTDTLIASTGGLINGEWTHVAGVYDGMQMILYLNGVQVGSTPKNGLVDVNNLVSMWIGGNPPGATSRPWEGSIDEVRLFNRALTLNEVEIFAGLFPNNVPVVVNQAYNVDEDAVLSPVAPGVLTGATDGDGDPLTAQLVVGPTNGTLLLSPTGSFTYTPDPDFNGADSFTFVANDGFDDSNIATATITIAPVNDDPVADSQAIATNEDTPLPVTLTGSDVDGDLLTFSVVTPPVNGVLSGTAPNLTYTPNADYFGPDSFTFVANDGTVDSALATISIDVNSVNDVPVADDDAWALNEDTVLNVLAPGVLDGDTDTEGDPLTAVLATQAANGTVVLNADGSFTYTPALHFNGLDQFTYTAFDGVGNSAPATVFLDVIAQNDQPVADDKSDSTQQNLGTPITLTGSDVDGDPLTFSVMTQPANGSLSGTAPNLTYTPNLDFTGPDSFTFEVNDGTINSLEATVSIDVTRVNAAPVADDDAYSVDEDNVLNVAAPGVLDGDTDGDGDPITAALVTGPVNGVLLLNSDGSFTYTPNAHFNGIDTFTYQADDTLELSNIATVTVTVAAVNDAPTADAQLVSTDEDVDLPITLTGSDIDGDPLTFVIVTPPSNGNLIGAAQNLIYSPNPTYSGPDSFVFSVDDGTALPVQATVTIDVLTVNDIPVADDDSYAVDEDGTLNVVAPGVLDGDTDEEGTPLTAAIVTGTANGVVSLSADGSFSYSPNPDFNGSDSFTYQASDGVNSSNIATVSITVNAINDTPVANGQSVSTGKDTPLPITLSGSDVDGDPLTYLVTVQPTNGTLSGTAPNLTYTPTAGYIGPDSFQFTTSDATATSLAATVQIDVFDTGNGLIRFFYGNSQTFNTVGKPQVWVDVLGNASDPEGISTLTYSLNGGPELPLLMGPDGRRLENTGDFVVQLAFDDLTLGPAGNQIVVTATDTGGDTTQGVVTLASPSVQPNVWPTDYTIDWSTVTDIQDAVQIVDGEWTFGPNGISNIGTYGYDRLFEVGDISWTDFTATVPMTVHSQQNTGGLAGAGLFIRWQGHTTSPNVCTLPGQPICGWEPYGNDAWYKFTRSGGVSDDAASNAQSLVDTTGLVLQYNVTYMLKIEVETIGSDNYYRKKIWEQGDPEPSTWTVEKIRNASDGAATAGSLLFIAHHTEVTWGDIVITPVGGAPTANADNYAIAEDSVLNVAAPGVLANDTDPESEPMTASVESGPLNGSLVLNSDGSFTYTPDPDFTGIDSFTYRASDPFRTSDPATVTLDVTPVNDAPAATAQSLQAEDGTPLNITLTGTDIDGDLLTFSVVTQPQHGVLSGTEPNVIYTATPGYVGPDSFTFTASDGSLTSPAATIDLTVFPPNDPPVAVADGYSVDEDVTLNVAAPGVLGNDSDPDLDPFTAELVTPASNGSVTLNADGSFTYNPAPDFNGQDSFTYRALDALEASPAVTVTITVNAVNDLPVAIDADVSTPEDVPLDITLTAADAEGDPLTYLITSQPTNGTLTGTAPLLTYTPNAGYSGPDFFTFTASDAEGPGPAASVQIDVSGINSGLIGHWEFDDGTATDSSPNGNDGTVNGASPAAGHVGAGSLDFDGTDDHVDLGFIDVPGTGFSVAAWINSDDLANCSSRDCRIVSKATGTATQDHYIMVSTVRSGGQVYLRFRIKAGGSTETLIASSGVLTNGVWAHIAATYDGSMMRVYVNGVLVGNRGKSGSIDVEPTVPMWIGGNPPSATSRPWDGKIDDVRLYDRALTDDQVALLASLAP